MTHQQVLFGTSEVPTQPRKSNGQFSSDEIHLPQSEVKSHLEQGLNITVLQCLKLYKSTELRKIISRLRRSGMNITDSWIKEGKKRFKVYKLVK